MMIEKLPWVTFGLAGRSDLEAGSLRTATAAEPGNFEELLATYLEQGSVLVAANGPWYDDAMDASSMGVVAPDVLTDGDWIWQKGLAYYLRRYHLRLSRDFVGHAESSFPAPQPYAG
jgi:hypothetical protein